jgi:hypothetical protein
MSFGVADPHFRVDQDRQGVQIAREHENMTALQEKSKRSRSTRIEDVRRCHIGW